MFHCVRTRGDYNFHQLVALVWNIAKNKITIIQIEALSHVSSIHDAFNFD